MNKFLTRRQSAVATFLALSVAAMQRASAAIDVSAITTGIADVGVALLAVIGAFLAVSVLILGISKVYSFVKRKAGA